MQLLYLILAYVTFHRSAVVLLIVELLRRGEVNQHPHLSLSCASVIQLVSFARETRGSTLFSAQVAHLFDKNKGIKNEKVKVRVRFLL